MSLPVSCQPLPWHQTLLDYLPLVRATAARACSHLTRQARDEAVSDVVADCTADFADLAAKGRPHFWLIPALARFAVRRRKAGRTLGSSANKYDVLSAVPRHEAKVRSLDALKESQPAVWRMAVADSHRTTPADAACFRVDFEQWLENLSARHRQLALALAAGERPSDLAKRMSVSPGRISQLRHELRDAWQAFHGDVTECVPA